ncbi:MAG: AmmeMemoRadiSam system protein B [Thermodesulfobacteriota bacterium]
MSLELRKPAVAGRFYEGDGAVLADTLSDLQPKEKIQPRKAKAVVSPHAGYIYSGSVAAETLAAVHIPETVIILGPNHHGQGAPLSLSMTDWEMPMGTVPVNREIGQQLAEQSGAITIDEQAHRFEHSLEVQVPFLQARQKNLSIVPLVVSQISYPLCEEVGSAIARTIAAADRDILIVASSDMTHYEPRQAAEKKDHYALKKLSDMDPSILFHSVLDHRISMCGIVPVTIALIAALELGATKTELIRYTDSGAVTGDTSQVVGYAGVVID